MHFPALQYGDCRPFRFFSDGKHTTKARYRDATNTARRSGQISCLHTTQGRNRRGALIFRHHSCASSTN